MDASASRMALNIRATARPKFVQQRRECADISEIPLRIFDTAEHHARRPPCAQEPDDAMPAIQQVCRQIAAILPGNASNESRAHQKPTERATARETKDAWGLRAKS